MRFLANPRLLICRLPKKSGDYMERINQFALYGLGQTLQKLRRYSGEIAPGEAFLDLMNASSALGELVKGAPLPIGVSLECAKELEKAVDSTIRHHFFAPDEGNERKFKFPAADAEKIPDWRWNSIKTALDKFETVFAEDMRENATYFAPPWNLLYQSSGRFSG